MYMYKRDRLRNAAIYSERVQIVPLLELVNGAKVRPAQLQQTIDAVDESRAVWSMALSAQNRGQTHHLQLLHGSGDKRTSKEKGGRKEVEITRGKGERVGREEGREGEDEEGIYMGGEK